MHNNIEQHAHSNPLPAIHRVDIPEGGIHENHIGDDYASGVHEFNKTRTCELKSSLPPHVPPDITLAIDCTILT